MLDHTRSEPATVRRPLPHDSAELHVSGEALYVDDLPEPQNLLHLAVALSPEACADIVSMNLDDVHSSPGVVAVLHSGNVPGTNDCSPTLGDDPVFADKQVHFAGQVLFAVAAESLAEARKACKRAQIEYRTKPAILTIEDAMEQKSWILEPIVLETGEVEKVLAESHNQLQGRLRTGGQDHFYLEGQIAMAVPHEAQSMQIYCSTQHPTEVQQLVAKVLGISFNEIIVEVRRMGGGFGGKETQAAQWACIAAIAARTTGRPAKLRLDRDTDMIATGKRHEFLFEYEVGFNEFGQIHALNAIMASNCGYSADLSGPINDRALLHIDNAYFFKHFKVVSYRCRTNTVSHTAFRGFGAPQAMMCIERIMDEVAAFINQDPVAIRRVNFYNKPIQNITPYKMRVTDFILFDLLKELNRTSKYQRRRKQIRAANQPGQILRKGIALTPVKFGISFTMTAFNQASALVHVYTDGSIHLNHGGTEMGQGLLIKVAQVVAEEFQVPLEQIKIAETNTSRVPNTSATAASSGSDMNGKAAQDAAQKIKQNLAVVASRLFHVTPQDVIFVNGRIVAGKQSISFQELVQETHRARIPLSATGHYRTPKIHWDRTKMSGRPFFYFGYGAAVSEVEIDTLTGEYRLVRVDILHDVGQSLNPAVDLGQVEGGFVQGAGWLTSEELWWDNTGVLRTHAPSTYKIPTCGDVPAEFFAKLWDKGRNREDSIYRSKAVGEPPFMLAISVYSAICDAISSVANYRTWPELDAPATPERILRAIHALKDLEYIA